MVPCAFLISGGVGSIADISGILAELQREVDAATGGSGSGSGSSIDPTPGDTAGGSELAKVKAFVGDVRTWGSVIKDETGVNGGALEPLTCRPG